MEDELPHGLSKTMITLLHGSIYFKIYKAHLFTNRHFGDKGKHSFKKILLDI